MVEQHLEAFHQRPLLQRRGPAVTILLLPLYAHQNTQIKNTRSLLLNE